MNAADVCHRKTFFLQQVNRIFKLFRRFIASANRHTHTVKGSEAVQ